MRFRFCGDLDCPDWVLAEIATLSKITSIKMKLLCAQVIKELIGDSIDYTKVFKLTSDAKYEIGDVKGAIAALSFILTNAAKHSVDGESLSNELQQLGLPKEHSVALCKAYEDKLKVMQEVLRKQSLRCKMEERNVVQINNCLVACHLHDIKFLKRVKTTADKSSKTDVSDVTMVIYVIEALRLHYQFITMSVHLN
ncbi:COMM domain-containing protein 4-like [Saccoglossus kowalevskii]